MSICLKKIIKGIQNPSFAIKYILGGGKKGHEKKMLSVIQDYSNDLQIINSLENFVNFPIMQYYDELITNKIYSEFQITLSKNSKNLGSLGPLEARILYLIIRSVKPKIVIETGVANGVSSTMILLAMNMNNSGKLFSIDYSNTTINSKKGGTKLPESKKSGWLIPQKLKERWELRLGDSKIILPKLVNELNECDVFLHDSDHKYEHMMFEFNTIMPYVKKFILSDDIGRHSAFDDFVDKNKLFFHKITTSLGIMKV